MLHILFRERAECVYLTQCNSCTMPITWVQLCMNYKVLNATDCGGDRGKVGDRLVLFNNHLEGRINTGWLRKPITAVKLNGAKNRKFEIKVGVAILNAVLFSVHHWTGCSAKKVVQQHLRHGRQTWAQCQRVHEMTVAIFVAAGIRTGPAALIIEAKPRRPLGP